jgi:hypothetical protein
MEGVKMPGIFANDPVWFVGVGRILGDFGG